MRHLRVLQLLIACSATFVFTSSDAIGQAIHMPQPNDGINFAKLRTGRLTDELGELITIEGIQPEDTSGLKGGATSLLVDTVNGVKLKKPRSIPITGFRIPPNVRCVLKGYETGRMIGTPPAVAQAAKELGKDPPSGSQAAYQWYTHFAVLIVVEPQSAPRVAPQKRAEPRVELKGR